MLFSHPHSATDSRIRPAAKHHAIFPSSLSHRQQDQTGSKAPRYFPIPTQPQTAGSDRQQSTTLFSHPHSATDSRIRPAAKHHAIFPSPLSHRQQDQTGSKAPRYFPIPTQPQTAGSDRQQSTTLFSHPHSATDSRIRPAAKHHAIFPSPLSHRQQDQTGSKAPRYFPIPTQPQTAGSDRQQSTTLFSHPHSATDSRIRPAAKHHAIFPSPLSHRQQDQTGSKAPRYFPIPTQPQTAGSDRQQSTTLFSHPHSATDSRIRPAAKHHAIFPSPLSHRQQDQTGSKAPRYFPILSQLQTAGSDRQQSTTLFSHPHSATDSRIRPAAKHHAIFPSSLSHRQQDQTGSKAPRYFPILTQPQTAGSDRQQSTTLFPHPHSTTHHLCTRWPGG